MKRPPVIATAVVLLAVAAMIGLGIWQLRRAEWKDALLTRYATAVSLPPIAIPGAPDPKNAPLFRRAAGLCLEVTGWRAIAGRNAAEEPGWSHIASCRTGAEGPGFAVDAGWSKAATNPAWRGGPVSGQLAPDRDHIYRLVATTPAPGLVPSAPPSIDAIPNNHRAYAVQWFIFAGIALGIYVLALRRRT